MSAAFQVTRKCLAVVLPLLAVLASCEPAASGDGTVARSSSPVVYGNDDRVDVWQESDADWRALATGASLALVRLTGFDLRE